MDVKERDKPKRRRMSGLGVFTLLSPIKENPPYIVGLMTLRDPITSDKLAEAARERLLPYFRMRSRVVNNKMFEEASDVDLRSLITEHHLGRKGGRNQLETLVGEICTLPMDPGLPLWRLHLVHGYEDGCAVVLRAHHCIGDGASSRLAVVSLCDPCDYDEFRPPSLSMWRRFVLLLATLTIWAFGAWVTLAKAVAALFQREPESPFRTKNLTGTKLVAWDTSISSDLVQAAGKKVRATFNDVMMGAYAGSLRHHMLRLESGVPTHLTLGCPVNLRTAAPTDFGNKFGFVSVRLPVRAETARERVLLAKRQMDRVKRTPEARVGYLLGTVGAYLPVRLMRAISTFFLSRTTVASTNMLGPRRHISLLGSQVREVIPFLPSPGDLAVSFAVCTYAGRVSVSCQVDAALGLDPGELIRGVTDELHRFVAECKTTTAIGG